MPRPDGIEGPSKRHDVARPGYVEGLERDAADPSRDVSIDWERF